MRRFVEWIAAISLCVSPLFISGCGQPAVAQNAAAQYSAKSHEFDITPGSPCIVLSALGGEVRGTFVREHEWWFVIRESKGNQSVHIRKDLISQVWVTEQQATR